VRLTHGLVCVLGQIDDGKCSPWRQCSPGFLDRGLRSGHVMQNHAGDDGINFTISDRQVLEITETEVAAIHRGLARRLPRQLEHRRRRIDGDDSLCTFKQRWQHQT